MKKHIKARRERNEQLGKREAQARCAHCKKPLEKVDILGGMRFCSFDCRDAALDYIDAVIERLK